MSSLFEPSTLTLKASSVAVSLRGQSIIIPSPNTFKRKINLLEVDGSEKIITISDFDFTMTRFNIVPGVRGASCHKVLEDSGLFGEDYEVKAQAVQRKYYAYEVDPSLDFSTKFKYMEEWVDTSHNLLLETNMTKDTLIKAVKLALTKKQINLRDRLEDFLSKSKESNVPFLIFSAGIADVLEEVLRQCVSPALLLGLDFEVISNRCIFEIATNDFEKATSDNSDNSSICENNKIIGFDMPHIHVMNKKSKSFLHTRFFQRDDIRARPNVFLLGDSPGDAGMADGLDLDPERIFKVAFLNDKPDERLHQFLNIFDLIILGDPDFDIPYSLLQVFCGNGSEYGFTNELNCAAKMASEKWQSLNIVA